MGVDAIIDLDMVMFNGTKVRCSKTENLDLFWAMRGAGGGNFGVVTSITLKTSPMPKVVSLMRFKWQNQGGKALEVWEKFVQDNIADEDISPQGYFSSGGTVRANIFYLGTLDELRRKISPLNAVPPASVSEKEVSWLAIVFQFASCKNPETTSDESSCSNMAHALPKVNPTHDFQKQNPWVAGSVYISKPIGRFWPDVFEAITKKYPGIIVIADPSGAAIAAAAESSDMAYSHRDAMYHFQIMGYFGSESGRKGKQNSVMGFYDYMVGLGNGIVSGAYYNYPNMGMLERPNWGKAYFGNGWDRLVALKKSNDPHNMFRSAFSIPIKDGLTSGVTDGAPDVAVLGKCERIGGVCKDESLCETQSVSSRCLGGASIKCCVPASVQIEDTKCGRLLGTCINVDNEKCPSGDFKGRKCPGSSSIKCCLN